MTTNQSDASTVVIQPGRVPRKRKIATGERFNPNHLRTPGFIIPDSILVRRDLNPGEKVCYGVVSAYPKASARECSVLMGAPYKSVARYLTRLRKLGLAPRWVAR